jgi:TonB-linked SusC/RagA family outer membrane protein
MSDVVGDRPVTDLAKALQGAAPGLQVTYGSGEPGAAATLNIRGVTSINRGSPLILVDNVPVLDISMVNPNDIESISVLKDAASASIYGGRTAFGVILITTKKAGKDQKVKFEYSNNFSLNRAAELPEKASPMQTVQAYKDGGYVSYWTGQVIDTWLGLLNDYAQNPSAYPDGSGYVTGLRYPLQQFDMAKDMFRTGLDQNHNLSMSGGSPKTAYRISLGSTNQNGLLVTDKDGYSRTSINSFVSSDIKNWFTAQLNVGYSNSDKTFPSTSYPYGIFGSLGVMPSYTPLGFDAAGVPYSTPKNLIDLSGPGSRKQGDLRTTGRIILTPLAGLKLTGEYTYNKLNVNETSFDKKFSVTNTSTFLPSTSTANSTYRKTLGFTDYKSINLFANYEKKLGQHTLSAIAGFNQEDSYTESLYSQMTQMINDDLPSISQGTGVLTSKDAFTEYGVSGWFGRLNYSFQDKYLLELNGRYDGSSKFPPGHKYGFFPSLSAGWRVGEEGFMAALKPVLSEFKLRGSWGNIGNQTILFPDDSPNNYPFIPGMAASFSNWIANNQRYNTLTPPALVSSNFTWEKVRSFNLGLNLGLFDHKFQGSFDWYQRETIGMLTQGAQLPSVLGTTAPLQNAANLRTNGWELEVSWRDKIGEVSYSIGANLYDTKSKITKYGNAVGNLTDRYVGQNFNEIYGYTTDRLYTVDDFVTGSLNSTLTGGTLKPGIPKVKGSFPNPGDVLYVDYNGDGEISVASNTLADPGDRKVIGNSTRRMQYGINGSLAWKGFDLSFFMQGIGKRDLWINTDLTFPINGEFSTLFASQTDYWTPNNLSANYARLYQRASGNTGNNRLVQTRYLANGAYWRLKNLTVGYTLPNLSKKVKVDKIRVFFSGENLFTYKHLPNGIDPEGIDKGNGITYPFTKMYSFGLNLNF